MSVWPEHAVRLNLRDDLQRTRLTVFFRLLLAIPHFVWAFLWTIAAFVATILNWSSTLAYGRPPEGLHGFLAAYVRYLTHLGAYLSLAANPYPGFTGEAGSYPVDVAIPGPEPQARWTVALRLLLAIPTLVLLAVLIPAGGGGSAGSGDGAGEFAYQGGSLLAAIAFLGWFAALVTGRMPHGLRNAALYALRYNAEATSYLLLLTGRYPNSDPRLHVEAGPVPERPVRLDVGDDLRRSRLTVFFRLLLALPHFVWIFLWAIAVFFAAIAAWVAALVLGRVPAGLHGFIGAFVRYGTHVYGYVLLAANPFPGFTGTGSYPVDLVIDSPSRQRRLVTLFRIFLALPALLLESALGLLAFAAAFLGWFASLATGCMPQGLRNLSAWYLRYQGQATAYLLLLTDRYPYSGPPVEEPAPEVEPNAVAVAA